MTSKTSFRLHRVTTEPLLKPRPDVTWERGAVLNSAVWEENGKTYLFYRAIDHDPEWSQGTGGRYQTSVGVAVSEDGLHFERREQPVIPSGFMGVAAEAQDCRIVKIEGTYYLTYCLYDQEIGLPSPGYSTSVDLEHWEHHGELVPFADFGYNKNAALFPEKIGGRFALLHRPEAAAYRHLPRENFNWRTWSRATVEGEEQAPGVTLSFSSDLQTWTDTKVILKPRRDQWDCEKVGPGAPPIRTPQGWLNVYHGVDDHHTYCLGIALHDLDNPVIVLRRQEEAILRPELDWERFGDVDGAIFTCGALLKPDGTLRVYYAGADTVLSLAEANVTGFLNG